jgi:hypothetical protein
LQTIFILLIFGKHLAKVFAMCLQIWINRKSKCWYYDQRFIKRIYL